MDLLQAIKARGQKQTQFNYGILTADAYVKTLQAAVGLSACYRLASKGCTSFSDLITKAAQTLVYSNEDMSVKSVTREDVQSSIELPKNTLMAFRHVLTSSNKDRDGDVLHSDGANPDPNMLLLWQHVHTLPIGKMLKVVDQSRKQLSVISAIVDMNELCHDSAVMVDNKMGRFSHGFKAVEFTETKADRNGRGGGFDITQFEVMEESLVSVPANTDAQTQEVLLSLVEGGKLTSPWMKKIGKSIRAKRPVQVQVKYRLLSENGDRKELVCNSVDELTKAVDAGLMGANKHENESGSGSPAAEGTGEGEGVSTNASKEADADSTQVKAASDKEVKCPECEWTGPMPKDGKCPECGADLSEEETEEPEEKATKDYSTAVAPASTPGALSGSWESIQTLLRDGIKRYLATLGFGLSDRDYVWVLSTFDKYVIACVSKDVGESHYKVQWELKDGKPTFMGEPEKIEIQTTTQIVKKDFNGLKVGRMISSNNETKIREAKDHVDEVHGAPEMPRSHKAMLRVASGNLKEVLDGLGEGVAEANSISVKDAMALVLTDATADERHNLAKALLAIDEVNKQCQQAKQIESLLSK